MRFGRTFSNIVAGLIFSIIVCCQPKITFSQLNSDSSYHILDVINRFEEFIHATLEEWDIPGAAFAIVKDDKIVYINGFGVREVGQPEKIDIHTVFRLASVSKGFAPIITGLLVRDGVLTWDDPVTKYLPEFALKNPKETGRLTIKHLLSHTSGLPAHTYTNLLDANAPLDNILGKLKEVGMIAPVGNIYSYQNIVYGLIADIVRSATGKDYSHLVTERIFHPLGMFDASLGREVFTTFHNRAKPHIRKGLGWTTTEVKQGYYNVPPAAGANASILDMARWLRAMMGGTPEIIAPDVINQVITPIIKTPQEKRKFRWRDHLKEAHYGLGWRIYDYGGATIVYHGGWVEGFRAEVGFIPDQKIGIAVLLNCETLAAALFLPTFFDMYLNFMVPDSIQTSSMNSSIWIDEK